MAALLIAGCTMDARTTRVWHGSIDTLETGIVLVQNPTQGLWDSVSAFRLETLHRIGQAAGDGPEVFGQVIALEADDAQRLYVLDRMSQEVRVFDAAGRYVQTVGREGEGPGEFRGANGMGWDEEGRFWVVDQRLKRFTVFDSLGEVVETVAAPMRIRSYEWQGWFTAAGHLYDYSFVGFGDSTRPVLLAFDMHGTYTDTLRLPYAVPEYFSWRAERGGGTMQIPFAPQPVWTVSPVGELWTSDARQYRIHRSTLSGDTMKTVTRDAPPIPVAEDERREQVEHVEEFMRGNPFDADRIPSVKPPFERFVVDGDGFLWVLRPEVVGSAGTELDVFDPEGRFLGSVRTESRVQRYPRFVIRGDRLYYVTTDDWDVPYVAVVQIIAP